jgi:protease-4
MEALMYRWICLTVLALTGCGTPSFLITPVANTSELEEVTVVSGGGGAFGSGGKIAMIPLEGMLINAKMGGFMQPTENPVSLFYQQLSQAAQDDSVKAVVLRVNSPGGTVSSADAMYQILTRFRQKTGKPVIVHTSEVCASGAYYVSCTADRIIVQPTTVIGSIGVIFNTFDASGTMNKIGLKSEAIKSAKNKDMGSPFNEYFDRFRSIVKQHRKIKDQDFTIVTDGRVFSGEKAVELGLADQTGLLEDAIVYARKSSGYPKAKVVTYQRPYAYGGSIYASGQVPQPQANVLQLQLPGEKNLLPSGFYYLWNP